MKFLGCIINESAKLYFLTFAKKSWPFKLRMTALIFSAPEPKAQVHYCDHVLSVVCPSSLTFHIFNFSSETAEENSTKLDRKQDLNVLYHVCVFWADLKNKMAALASDWLRHFLLLLWNCWTEFNLTGSKISTSCTKFVFLAHLSRRLQWAIVIAHRPLSVRPSVVVVRP